jgi:hypothetical protein
MLITTKRKHFSLKAVANAKKESDCFTLNVSNFFTNRIINR